MAAWCHATGTSCRYTAQLVWLDRVVQHENVDKDPDLRKSSDVASNGKSWVPRLITFVAISAVITGFALVLIYYSPNWGPSQWGDVATWVAGIATSAAVSVSLWQAYTAKQKAIRDEIAAAERLAEEQKRHAQDSAAMEARHQAELQRADNRLLAQLNEQRRVEQIEAVRSLCDSMSNIFNSTWEEMARVNSLTQTIGAQDAERSRRERQAWIRTINDSSQDAALAMIGLQDHQLIEQAEWARHTIEDLRKEITGPEGESIDWDCVTERLNAMTGSKKAIMSMATIKLQPEYRAYILKKARSNAASADASAPSGEP